MTFTPHATGTSPIRARNSATTALLRTSPAGTEIIAMEDASDRQTTVAASMISLRRVLEGNGFTGVKVRTEIDRPAGVVRGYISLLNAVPTQKSASATHTIVINNAVAVTPEKINEQVEYRTARLRRDGRNTNLAYSSLMRVLAANGVLISVGRIDITGLSPADLASQREYLKKRQSALSYMAKSMGYTIRTNHAMSDDGVFLHLKARLIHV